MLGTVEIINLVDNYVSRPGTLAEHGLSFLIRTADQAILFDTGSGAVIDHNILEMGINMRDITAVALSHGHYDHTGGLKKVLDLTGPVPVFAHSDIFGGKYSIEQNKKPRYTGIPWSQEELERRGADFHFNRQPVEIAENVILTGEVPRQHDFENETGNMYLRSNDNYIPDTMLDDQSMLINTSKGLVVILGCAHSGVINILEYALAITGEKQIYAVIGGTHLKSACSERLKKTIDALLRFNLHYFAGCHCTGLETAAVLAQALGDKFVYCHAGKKFRIE